MSYTGHGTGHPSMFLPVLCLQRFNGPLIFGLTNRGIYVGVFVSINNGIWWWITRILEAELQLQGSG